MTCAEKVLCFLFLMNLFAFAFFDYFDFFFFKCVFCHENVATDKKYLGLLFLLNVFFCHETFL